MWKTPLSLSSVCASCWYSCSPISPSPSHFSLRRFITQHRQQQRGGFIWVLSLKRDVTKPHSTTSTPSDSVLHTFSNIASALIATVLIKVMNHPGGWADLRVRTPSWCWRLHEITIRDPPWPLARPKLSQWRPGIKVLPTPWERTYQILQALLNNCIPSTPPAEEWMVPS